jgi:hypothetical protein
MRLAQERNNEEVFKKNRGNHPKGETVFVLETFELGYVTGKKRTGSAMLVQVEEQLGLVSESTTKDTVEAAIFREVHDKCYTLAKEALICSRRPFDDFGYVANSPAARAVLDGTYQAPEGSDIATKELFDEVAAIRRLIPKDSVPTIITPDQWKR